MGCRRVSALENSIEVTISRRIREAPPAGASDSTRKRSNAVLPQFVEIVVGPSEELKGWVSPKEDLVAIPYFRSLLGSPVLKDAKACSFRLPDDDPEAFGQVLHFARHGELQYDLPALCKQNNKDNPDKKNFFARSQDVVKTYVLAQKLGMEALQNAACDAIRNSLTHLHLTSSEMRHIVENCEKDDPLYRLSMQALAVSIHKMGWSRWRVNCSWWFQAFVQGAPENVQLIADALTTYKDFEYPTTGEGVCQWHTHNITSPCEPTPTEPETDITDQEQFLWGNQESETVFDGDEVTDETDTVETEATAVEENGSDVGEPKAET